MSDAIRVLHVDDEPDFAEMAAEFLTQQSERITVETARNADEARTHIEQEPFDCVVSDFDMPGQTGIELLEAIREEFPELPFILFTGKGSEEIASTAISAGVTDYLQKEAGRDQYVILANRIENAVDKARAEYSARDAQSLYRSLMEDALDTSAVGTFILDANFDIVWINSAIESYFDIDRNEVIGEDKRQLIASHIASIFEAPTEFAETVTATYDDNSYVEEFECHVLEGEDREQRWLRHWSQPIESGRFAGGRIEHYTDITEYKEREQEIARIKEQHETVLANIRDTLLVTDDTGRFTYVCPNVEFIFGYDREEVAELGTIESLLDGQLVEAEELRSRGEIHNLETTVENKAGQRRHLLVTVTAVDIEDGSQLYSIRDITDRADQEHAYRELSRRHNLALDATQTGVWEWNMETNEVLWSDALERLVGIEPGEFEGTFEAHEEFLHPDSMETLEQSIEQALDGDGRFDAEFRMIRADGEVIWVHGQGKVFTEDGPNRMLGITTEITEKKAREQELEQTNTLLSTLFETLPVGVTVLDTDGSISRANRRAEKVLGLTESEITERTYDDLEWQIIDDDGNPIPGEDLPFGRVMETGETVLDYEHGIRWPDGRERWLSINATPLATENGAVEQVVAVMTDITDQRNQEQALRRQNERLEEFASIVSHDLRNPLNVAEGRLELAREELDNEDLHAVARAHERMNALIDDLLTLAREGEIVGETDPTDLMNLTENCWRNVATAEATLMTAIDRRIHADENRLQQLLENLFRNAVEHGGDDVTITVGEMEGGFYVEDDGLGIPEDDRDQVFDAGYSTTEDGTGFGLSIVKQVAQAHGWDVRVTDGSEGGARFEITNVGFAT